MLLAFNQLSAPATTLSEAKRVHWARFSSLSQAQTLTTITPNDMAQLRLTRHRRVINSQEYRLFGSLQ